MPEMPKTYRSPALGPVRERIKAADARRGSAFERGYDRWWYRASARFRREHPLCCCCKANGVIAATEVTDHIVPHKGDMVLLRNPANWQSLCARCHNTIKKRLEALFEAGKVAASALRLDRQMPEFFDLSGVPPGG